MMKRMLALVLALLLSTAFAEGALIEDGSLELSGNSVRYPVLKGLEDETLQESINRQLQQTLQVDAYLNRMALLMSSPVKLTVTHQTHLTGGLLSAAVSARGAVKNNRSTHVWTTAVIDLENGEALALDALFTDPASAREYIESYLDEMIAPELSPHLSASALTPLPECFTVSRRGLTLYYPIDQLATLSDQAGAVELAWTEIRSVLDLSEGSMLQRLGAGAELSLTGESAARLAEEISQGRLAHLPLTLGQSVQTLTDEYGLLLDPDEYEGGRMIQLEGAAFRQVYLLTDALTDTWSHSTLQGIRLDRANLHGLCTGFTTIAAWREALGEPDSTVTVDASQAESWRTVPGQSDYYVFGDVRLRLHADEDGVLHSIWLMQ